jgi:hypothetical protein
VADSPYPVRLLPGPPSARHSTVSGPGRHTAAAGTAVAFDVTVRDAYGNSYSMKWDRTSAAAAAAAAAGAAGAGADADAPGSSTVSGGGSRVGKDCLSAEQLQQQLPLQVCLMICLVHPYARHSLSEYCRLSCASAVLVFGVRLVTAHRRVWHSFLCCCCSATQCSWLHFEVLHCVNANPSRHALLSMAIPRHTIPQHDMLFRCCWL